MTKWEYRKRIKSSPLRGVRLTDEELDWLKHASGLRGLTVNEYVRRAINMSMRKEGVDAVLMKERPSRKAGEVPPPLNSERDCAWCRGTYHYMGIPDVCKHCGTDQSIFKTMYPPRGPR